MSAEHCFVAAVVLLMIAAALKYNGKE